MKKFLTPKNIFLSLLTIMMIGIFYRFFTLLEFPDSSTVLEKGELIKLQPREVLTQKFVVNRDNLTKIQILFRTPGPNPASDVKMEIAEQDCKKILRTGKLSTTFLNSDNLYEFAFSKIPASNGKILCLIATFEPSKSDSKAIRFFAQSNNLPPFAVQNMTSGEQNPALALSMRPVYVNDHLWQNLSELNQRVSQYKPWFLKHFYIATIGVLFVVLSVGLVTILILM